MAVPTIETVEQVYEGNAIQCAKIVVPDEDSDYKFANIAPISGDYVFQMVARTENESKSVSVSVGNIQKTITIGLTYTRHIERFEGVNSSGQPDMIITFPPGTYYTYNMQLERASTPSAWRPAPEDNADEARDVASETAAAAIEAQTQEDIFNKLTNGDQQQGLWMQNGKIYINGTYINTGTLTVRKNGNETFYANVDTGEVRINADSFSLTGKPLGTYLSETLDAAEDYADDAASGAVASQTQESIYNKLTNNGQMQGIFLNSSDHKLYINASYINTGIFTVKKSGVTTFSANANTGEVNIIADTFSLRSGSTTKSVEQAAYDNLSKSNLMSKISDGTNDGIYLSGGKIRINASYIASGAIPDSYLSTTIKNGAAAGTEANARATSADGTSETGARTASKVAVSNGFKMTTGASISVLFTYANTIAGELQLAVNDGEHTLASKVISVDGAATSATNQLLWVAGTVLSFKYDGTYWKLMDAPGTYLGGTVSAAAGTAEKEATCPGLVMQKGTVASVYMTYANTNASATLNLAGLYAKNIYYGTTTTRPTDLNGHGWIAGRAVTFEFDGANWRMRESATIIDGGHIKTGTIDADVVNVANIHGDNIKANSISVNKLTGTIQNSGWVLNLTNGTFTIGNISADKITSGTIAAARIDTDNLIAKNLQFYANNDTERLIASPGWLNSAVLQMQRKDGNTWRQRAAMRVLPSGIGFVSVSAGYVNDEMGATGASGRTYIYGDQIRVAIDRNNIPRVLLEEDSTNYEGNGRITIYDSNGKERAKLTKDAITFLDASGNELAHLNDAQLVIKSTSGNGVNRVVLSRYGLTFRDESGNVTHQYTA